MKHTKQEKQLINEWLANYIECQSFSSEANKTKVLKEFQKQHNLIDDELEVGKWYKNKILDGTLYFIHTKNDLGVFYYGINHKGEWSNEFLPKENFDWLIEVKESYVIERLTWYAEQVMKYNHEKPNYKCLCDGKLGEKLHNLKYYIDGNEFWVEDVINDEGSCLMKDGVWATTFEVEEKKYCTCGNKSLFVLLSSPPKCYDCKKPFTSVSYQPIKPAYKSKGGEHGKRIIERLVELGGNNTYYCFSGNSKCYYFIGRDGSMDLSKDLPQGYTECFLEEQTQTITIKIPKGVDYKIEEYEMV